MKNFFVLEGIDGSGKTTIATALVQRLKSECYDTIFTNEPYRIGVGTEITHILKTHDEINPMTSLFLFEAARVQHINDIIKPAINSGKIVICDRYTGSSLAYQGLAEGLPIDLVSHLNDIAIGYCSPTMTFWIDTDIDTCMGRNKKEEARDRKPREYYERCRDLYQSLVDEGNTIRIDGNRSVDAIVDELMLYISQNTRLKCVYCGTDDDSVMIIPDPYELEVNGDETEHPICEKCKEERIQEI